MQEKIGKAFSPLAVFGALAAAFILIALGALLEHWYGAPKTAYLEPVISRKSDPRFPLIKPLMRVDFPAQLTFSELTPLRTALQTYIDGAAASGTIKRASVYFRDTTSAHWVGIGQDDEYHPASLLKVFYLTALYKQAEINPDILKEKVYFSGAAHNSADQVQYLRSGHYYTLDELGKAMIVESDNDAKDVLLTKIDSEFLMQTLIDNGIQSRNNDEVTISPRMYTTFFRTLYNATFLNETMSERALELLSDVKFTDGLVSGTPRTIKIAHKYGEYANMNEKGQVVSLELHDCGLVYYPNRPYYVCVMTEGYDRDDLERVIQGVARTAYSAFAKLYPAQTSN